MRPFFYIPVFCLALWLLIGCIAVAAFSPRTAAVMAAISASVMTLAIVLMARELEG